MNNLITTDNFTRIDNDSYGNPRYYIPVFMLDGIEHKTLNKLGFKLYRGKKYGKGYVVQSYNIQHDCDRLNGIIMLYQS